MTRFSTKRFNTYVLLLMAVYIALLWFVWPHLRDAHDIGWKIAIAVSPAIPVTWVIALMARRVLLADELEQRIHLIALGVATALVGTACLIAGFLAMGKVWRGDGSEVFWVFPALCCIYGFTRMGLRRRITGVWGC